LLTLTAYRRSLAQPWHCHANPTFFVLLAGTHLDHSRHAEFEQPPFSLVYHPTTSVHAGEPGPRGMRGLNIEYEPRWLDRHELRAEDLGDYRPLASPRARLAAVRFVATAFQPGHHAAADLQTRALEFLAELVDGPAESGLAPAWLRRAEDFLRTYFREPVSLRDAAREAGVHPVYLARVFRRRNGRSVSGYLTLLRLAEAGRLVLEGASLVEASHAAGFSDQAHFSRRFSRECGFSPKKLLPVRSPFDNECGFRSFKKPADPARRVKRRTFSAADVEVFP
jgi:AraC family transcriptional regulator